MSLYNNEIYREDLAAVAEANIDFSKLSGKTVVISGATGLIGKFLVDVLLFANNKYRLGLKVVALGRNEQTAKARFDAVLSDGAFSFVTCDINKEIGNICERADYVFHLASTTHPLAYSTDPIGTVCANVIGTNNLLSFAASKGCERFVFASTVEVYGENRGDTELFSEDYCGYINCNTLRAGYPESKRAGEALCQGYIRQKGMDIIIPRLARTFGPTLLSTDTKAISQFLKKGAAGEDIVLKSEGKQFYSYTYVADAVCAMLFLLFKGKCGECYNVAYGEGNITLKELAETIAFMQGKKVVFELPDETEKAGYSTATKAVMSGEKLSSLGWRPIYTLDQAIKRTVEVLKSENEN